MVQQLSLQGSLFDLHTVIDYGQSVINVASELVKSLQRNSALTTKTVQGLMNRYLLGTAAEGAWSWKDAYEAIEVAQILYVRSQAELLSAPPLEVVRKLQELTDLCPTQTRRSEEQVKLQQFSTPLPLAYLIALSGQVRSNDLVLEPSAGTGLVAQFALRSGASLMLNELASDRSKILRRLFPGVPLFQVNAEQINDFLAGQTRPSVVLMNPPFSASPKMSDRNDMATTRHINSALQKLEPGGRLVTLTANWFSPLNPEWQETFLKMQEFATVVLSVGIAGKVYAKHGTQMDTRLTVIDKVGSNKSEFNCVADTVDLPQLLNLIEQLPPRPIWLASKVTAQKPEKPVSKTPKQRVKLSVVSATEYTDVVPLEYSIVECLGTNIGKSGQPSPTLSVERLPLNGEGAKIAPSLSLNGLVDTKMGNFCQGCPDLHRLNESTASELKDELYQTYRPQKVQIHGVKPHPSLLCESVALALVRPPAPTYKPLLPLNVVKDGLLSEAQLESIIYAGQAHSQFLSGSYLVDDSFDNVTVAASSQSQAVKYRKGWFLGDNTGCGKGRQIAGTILDNWCHSRKKAIWISKSAALIEDARRDWSALGGNEKDIIDLSDIKLGTPIPFESGIIFATYSTLRSVKGEKSRLKQIIDWALKDFQGVIAFDECHAMGGAMAQQGYRGIQKASMQGLVGIRLQNALPLARVVYVSATGATKVSNLCYANRLGLWQTGDFPFTSREDFVASIESGGIAAMEVVARDLKALGLYLARALSFEGSHTASLVSTPSKRVEDSDRKVAKGIYLARSS